MPTPNLQPVLSHYPADCQPRRVETLGSAGGYSGAAFWRLSTNLGPLCLRRWPAEHPTPEQLALIHSVLLHVARNGFRKVPVPQTTKDGATFVSQGGSCWELTPWLSGQADFHTNPNPSRLRAALEALAQFHVAAISFPHAGPRIGPSPGLAQRRDMLGDLLSGGIERLSGHVFSGKWPDLEPRARRLFAYLSQIGPALLRDLAGAVDLPVPLQPCIRDIWHDHVLFQADEVSGLIDFGAMRIETPSGDLARLLGSLVRDDAASWQAGLAAYQAVRLLTANELRLVSLFDRSSVLLSGVNWLTWICVEQRVFPDLPRILARLDETIARLEYTPWNPQGAWWLSLGEAPADST